jgi:hypothetical protein
VVHGDADAGQLTPRSTFYDMGRFGRLFPTLPPFSADVPLIRDALTELGAAGGPMDAQDDLSDPVTLITDPAKSAHNPDNPTLTAGFTFLGQFLDHDMTFDPTSSLARAQDPESIRNFRIPALDLDSVYGGGPAVSPYLYDQTVDGGRTTFLTEEIPGSAAVSVDGSARRDLPRNSQVVALIADPRNDENMMVSGLQQALLRFHNQVYLDVAADLGTAYTVDETFAEAQRVVRWHYQWMVLHEFLSRTVGQATAQDVLENGLKFFDWCNNPYIPVEFSVGAYRFGHSQVRPSYRANFGTSTTDLTQQFFALLFKPGATDPADPDDLRGGRRAPRRFIDWQTFFDFGDGPGAAEQEDRHHAVVGAVQPAGPGPGNPGLPGHPEPAAQPHHGGAVRAERRRRDVASCAGAGRPVRPAAAEPAQPDPAVVLHPARGPGHRRRRTPRAGGRAHRRRGHLWPDPRRQPVLPRPRPGMDTGIRHGRHLHHRGPAHQVRHRRIAGLARIHTCMCGRCSDPPAEDLCVPDRPIRGLCRRAPRIPAGRAAVTLSGASSSRIHR